MFTPHLQIKTSAMSSPPQSPPPILAVHDLLDHTWHYDCVVSPTYSSSSAASLYFTSPDPFTTMSPCQSPRSPSPSPPAPTHLASQYVSLSSFINSNSPSPNSTQTPAERFRSRSPSPPLQSSQSDSSSTASNSSSSSSSSSRSNFQCGDRERQSHASLHHSSRISFYEHGFFAVD